MLAADHFPLPSPLFPLLQDVIELRERHWKERNDTDGVQTLAQIREKAAKDAQKASAEATQSMARSSSGRNDSSRGGSRRGANRTDFGAPTLNADGWSTPAPAPRNAGKVGDLKNFGQIEKPAARQPASFGPSGVFSKKKNQAETPPMSRTPSSANMFSLLGQDSGNATGDNAGDKTDDGEPAPQRKRLVLQKRSVPLPDDEGADKDGDDDDEASAKDDKPKIDEAEAKRLIKTRVDEFYNVRDYENAVDQFKELPAVYHKLHLDKLVSHAIDAKKVDLEATVKLFGLLAKNSIVTKEAFVSGFEGTNEFIDDLVTDVPNAYPVFASLLVAAKLDKADVEALGDKIDLGGEPSYSPKEKLVGEFEKAVEAGKSE